MTSTSDLIVGLQARLDAADRQILTHQQLIKELNSRKQKLQAVIEVLQHDVRMENLMQERSQQPATGVSRQMLKGADAVQVVRHILKRNPQGLTNAELWAAYMGMGYSYSSDTALVELVRYYSMTDGSRRPWFARQGRRWKNWEAASAGSPAEAAT